MIHNVQFQQKEISLAAPGHNETNHKAFCRGKKSPDDLFQVAGINTRTHSPQKHIFTDYKRQLYGAVFATVQPEACSAARYMRYIRRLMRFMFPCQPGLGHCIDNWVTSGCHTHIKRIKRHIAHKACSRTSLNIGNLTYSTGGHSQNNATNNTCDILPHKKLQQQMQKWLNRIYSWHNTKLSF